MLAKKLKSMPRRDCTLADGSVSALVVRAVPEWLAGTLRCSAQRHRVAAASDRTSQRR